MLLVLATTNCANAKTTDNANNASLTPTTDEASGRKFGGLIKDPHPFKQCHPLLLSPGLRHLVDLYGCQNEIFQYCFMGIEFKMLEHHSNAGTKRINVCIFALDRNPIHKNFPGLELFQAVDAPEKGAFPRSTGAADDQN